MGRVSSNGVQPQLGPSATIPPVARTRSDGNVRPGKAAPSGYRGRGPMREFLSSKFRWFNAEGQISWQPRNTVEVSEADRATSQTILKKRVRRAKKAASIHMAVVRNKADLIPGVPPSRADRRGRQADPAAAPATLQRTRRRPARRGKKAANTPTAGNSAFRVVRAGRAPSSPALLSAPDRDVDITNLSPDSPGIKQVLNCIQSAFITAQAAERPIDAESTRWAKTHLKRANGYRVAATET
jgi:hypothetical protein